MKEAIEAMTRPSVQRKKAKFKVGQDVMVKTRATIVDTIASGFICCINGFEFPCHLEQLRKLTKRERGDR